MSTVLVNNSDHLNTDQLEGWEDMETIDTKIYNKKLRLKKINQLIYENHE